ncbi:type I secretion system permease/ATPase [Halomonas sp. GD1P12]|uniref:type I secretion system permease/ATPase n=1 Tax=Halomonas sp. GD1P12 TaxID=2982691 RepID=UPI0021E387F2|nr:type I secretion system permease/ATPase [Halomonas sp. GD1P12]UYF98683.1 type I secretion system permease/ATPase [Halomonas sp. GD1P12]
MQRPSADSRANDERLQRKAPDRENLDHEQPDHTQLHQTVSQQASSYQAHSQQVPPPQTPSRQTQFNEGLALLCRQLGRPTVAIELTDGFALADERLPLALVPRALNRIGVTGRVVELTLSHLCDGLLPALILLDNDAVCVLVECQGDEAVILVPESGGGQERLALSTLAKRYAGVAVVARQTYRADDRAGRFARKRPEHWLKGPVRRQWKTYVEVGVAALMANLLAIATAIFAMQVYDRVVPNNALDTLWILSSGVALAAAFEFLLRVLRARLIDATGKRLDLGLSSRLFEQVMQLRLSAKPGTTGAFSSQLREFESVREFFTSSTIGAISDLPFVALFIGVIAYIGGPVAWVVLAAVVLMLLPGLIAQPRLASLARQNLREGAVRQCVLLETLENLETVKTTRAEGRHLRMWDSLSASLADAGVRMRSLGATLGFAAAFVQQLCYIGVVIVGVYQISAGALTVGALIACTLLASRTVAPMSQVAGLLTRWQHVKVALEGLDDVMKAPVERPEGRSFIHKSALAGHFELEGVKLAYQPEGPPALNIERLEIAAGERVALLGGNGSGKSTLLRLLAGLGDASDGQMLLDGVAISQLEPADKRRAIGYLPQDIALFYGTLRENLLLDGQAHTDETLMEALASVGLGSFVGRHPHGLDMPLQGSRALSGGQRQAVGLARLLLQDPRIVLLDEPTAAFDQSSERHVIQTLNAWLEKRTLILATHKSALLTLTERALVLREGRLVMDGPVESVVSGNQVNTAQKPQGVRRHDA